MSWQQAKARADEVRQHRYRLKGVVQTVPMEEGRRMVAALFADPPDYLGSLHVETILQWPRRCGADFVRKVLQRAGFNNPGLLVFHAQEIRSLSERERRAVARAVTEV